MKHQIGKDERDKLRGKIRFNLFIIREVYNSIKFYSEFNKMDFYAYLDIDKKIFDFQIATGNGDLSKFLEKLSILGISKEYLCYPSENISEEYAYNNLKQITVDEDIDEMLTLYLDDRTLRPIKEVRNVIVENLYRIKNLDGSLIIENIFNYLVNTLPAANISKDCYTLADNIADTTSDSYLSSLKLRRYYNNIAANYKTNASTNIAVFPTGDIPDKKIHYSENDNHKYNLLLIRELFLLCANLEELENPEGLFYNFIGYDKSSYNEMIETGKVQTRILHKKLGTYKIPASIFRGDKPTLLGMSDSVLCLLDNYFINNSAKEAIDLHTFQEKLKIEFLYRYDIKNFPLFMSIYSIIKDIKNDILKPYKIAELLSELDETEIAELKSELENSI